MVFEPKVLAPGPGTRAKATFRWLQTQSALSGYGIFKPPALPEAMISGVLLRGEIPNRFIWGFQERDIALDSAPPR